MAECLFLNLATEITLQIFDYLPYPDISRMRRVCRRFNDLADQCRPSYTFRVDAPDLQTWRLVRCLLRNPNIVANIKTIDVEWKRRTVTRSNNGHITGEWGLTERWEWTEEETKRINHILQTLHLFNPLNEANLQTAMLGGVNSEALLPFLLSYTQNLENLDLGVSDGRLVRGSEGTSLQSITRALHSILAKEEQEKNPLPINFEDWVREVFEPELAMNTLADPENVYYDIFFYLYDDISEPHIERMLWFQNYLQLAPTVCKGLLNLKTFFLVYKNIHQSIKDENRTLAESLVRILSLPSIQTVHLEVAFDGEVRILAGQPGIRWNISSTNLLPMLEELGGHVSTARSLEVVGTSLTDEDYMQILMMTGFLEHLLIVKYKRQIFYDKKSLGTAFLEQNQNSLSKTGIRIVDGHGELNHENWESAQNSAWFS